MANKKVNRFSKRTTSIHFFIYIYQKECEFMRRASYVDTNINYTPNDYDNSEQKGNYLPQSSVKTSKEAK